MPAVRAAVSADLAAVRTLLGDARLVLDGLDALGGDLLVADVDGRIVGAVGCEVHGPDGLLRSLVVAPDRRGTGLGIRLTEALTAHARARGLATLYLLTETAEPFFAARGFRRVPRAAAPPAIAASHEFSVACAESAAFMALPLA